MEERPIFISYSHKDVNVAFKICDLIESRGILCWIGPRNVPPSRSYPSEIVKAIKQCKIVLLIASITSNNSEHVMNEIELAVNNSKIILPFKIDENEYNDNLKYYLNRKHRIEAYPDPSDYYNELLRAVEYLLNTPDIETDTLNNQQLIAISERNRIDLIHKTYEDRFSFGLSIKSDTYQDTSHFYEKINRIDIIESDKFLFTSYRWLTITNVSEKPTHSIIHKECGENKIQFKLLNVKAKEKLEGKSIPLLISSLTDKQPNFEQVFVIYFARPLMPGESMNIFYRIEWPGEILAYCPSSLSMSISLTRYTKGVKELNFSVLDNEPIYGFELIKVSNSFEEKEDGTPFETIKIQDIPEMKPLHDKSFSGVRYSLADAVDGVSYRILYKKQQQQLIDISDEF